MKIAVIDHIGNPGGGSRVARALLPAMKKLRPELEITFFGNAHSMKRDGIEEIANECDIHTEILRSVKHSGKDLLGIRGSRHIVSLMQRKMTRFESLVPFSVSGAVHKELEKRIIGFDIAFFTWPFHLKSPRLDCPMVGIFHDYNFKYYFTGHPMLPWVTKFLKDQMPDWLERSTPIVSTEFMRTEIQKFYPNHGHKVRVVPIAPMSTVKNIDLETARHNVRKLGIENRYILCPTNISSHKNVGPLISALPLLKQKFPDLILVFVGSGTEVINGRACTIGVETDETPKDVYGLGYVSNEQVDSLIQGASAVVNPSLYEGGNGAGFDAWAIGSPVAMSNIPPFLEHLSTHEVHAEIFDPRSPKDIAEKIDLILSDPERTHLNVKKSQEAIARFTWEYSARKYLEIFDDVLQMQNL